LRAAGLQTRLQLCPLSALDSVQEQALSQAVIEAATNIVRHANANKVSVEVTFSDSMLTLVMQDDGGGGSIVPGNGLGGMRQRLEAVNGELMISSAEPGLRLTASLRVNAGPKKIP
jgi:two-component system, NarL family, sensor histidine kinase DesK